LANRAQNVKLETDPRLHLDTKLWAALQDVSGGTWAGCVYDSEKIIETLEAGQQALRKK
jgi:hypothetical protein